MHASPSFLLPICQTCHQPVLLGAARHRALRHPPRLQASPRALPHNYLARVLLHSPKPQMLSACVTHDGAASCSTAEDSKDLSPALSQFPLQTKIPADAYLPLVPPRRSKVLVAPALSHQHNLSVWGKMGHLVEPVQTAFLLQQRRHPSQGIFRDERLLFLICKGIINRAK